MGSNKTTYAYLRVWLQWEGCKARLLFVGGNEGNGILGAKAQRQLLAACWHAGNRLQTCLEVRDGPRGGDPALGGGVGRRDEQRHVRGGLE